MSDLVKTARVTIDDIEVEVPEGTLIIEAARQAGISIPHFCYHPRLEPVGMCRQCLVEIEGMRRLVASCTQRVQDGLQVKVNTSEQAVRGRKATLEFLLVNHPLDCPVCDKGGECPLQDQYYEHSAQLSRFEEEKRRWPKPVPLSDHVLLDMERCVLCKRCVRFSDEIAGEAVLQFFSRGWHTEIRTFYGEEFDSHFSGNTIDLCPVGALTSRSFRFQARAWELRNFASICPYCPCGCNITVGQRVNEIKRVTPRVNEAVNQAWICDKGRFDYRYTQAENRLLQPLVRRNGELTPATWQEAIATVAARLHALVEAHGADSVAALGSPWCSNEDNYLLQRIVRGVIGSNNVTTKHDDLRSNGFGHLAMEDIEKADAFLFVGADVIEELPIAWLRVYQAVRGRGAQLLIAHPQHLTTERHAAVALTYPEGQDLLLAKGLVAAILEEKLHDLRFLRARGTGLTAFRETLKGTTYRQVAAALGGEPEALRAMAQALAGAQHVIIFAGRSLLQGPHAQAALAMLRNLLLLIGKPEDRLSGVIEYLPYANSQGTLDMGIAPDLLPGPLPVKDRGARQRLGKLWGVGELSGRVGLRYAALPQAAVQGKLKALYVMGADPLRAEAHPAPAQPAWVEHLELLVVQDLALTATARQADVVLPAACFAEKEGTFTNGEKRVQRLYPGMLPPGEALADHEILSLLGCRLRELRGRGPENWPRDSAAVMEEIIRAVPHYAGMEHSSLGTLGRRQVSERAIPDRWQFAGVEE